MSPARAVHPDKGLGWLPCSRAQGALRPLRETTLGDRLSTRSNMNPSPKRSDRSAARSPTWASWPTFSTQCGDPRGRAVGAQVQPDRSFSCSPELREFAREQPQAGLATVRVPATVAPGSTRLGYRAQTRFAGWPTFRVGPGPGVAFSPVPSAAGLDVENRTTKVHRMAGLGVRSPTMTGTMSRPEDRGPVRGAGRLVRECLPRERNRPLRLRPRECPNFALSPRMRSCSRTNGPFDRAPSKFCSRANPPASALRSSAQGRASTTDTNPGVSCGR